MKTIAAPISDTIHEVKSWPEYFQRVKAGIKTFEVRKNDRNYQVNDFLRQKEWNPDTEKYTGDVIEHRISYIVHGGQFGIEKGFVVMQLDKVLMPLSDNKVKH